MAGTASPVSLGDTGNTFIDGLTTGVKWDSGGATTTISYDIAGLGGAEPVSNGVTALRPLAGEAAAYRAAMASFEAVCRVDFREVAAPQDADLIWSSVNSEDGMGALGWATLPVVGAGPDHQSFVAINQDAYEPTDGRALQAGGYDFCTLIHELGHALGLGHSHEAEVGWPGVDSAGDLGSFGLNQGVYTIMGYNDGWTTAPHGRSSDQLYGYQAGPMALDVAALQHMFGANASHRTGADTYRLPDANKPGAAYRCIWDAGGIDTIQGAQARANSIDLRSATLETAPGGGGFVSYAQGIHGGLTIAKGALIENATGGSQADVIGGNFAANVLTGLGGNDSLMGRDGADRLVAGGGRDKLSGGAGYDDFVFQALGDSAVGVMRDQITDFSRQSDDIVLSGIDARAGVAGNQAFTLDASGAFAEGEIRQVRSGRDLVLEMNVDADAGAEMSLLVMGVGTLTVDDFHL